MRETILITIDVTNPPRRTVLSDLNQLKVKKPHASTTDSLKEEVEYIKTLLRTDTKLLEMFGRPSRKKYSITKTIISSSSELYVSLGPDNRKRGFIPIDLPVNYRYFRLISGYISVLIPNVISLISDNQVEGVV